MFGPSKRQLLRTLERERERHEAIEKRLVEQICHLSGKPWAAPPVAAETDAVRAERERRAAEQREAGPRYVARPELLPD